MRQFNILLIIINFCTLCKGQNESNVFQDYFNELVYTQVFNELKVEMPVFIFIPDFIFITTVEQSLTDIYFRDNDSEINPFDKPSEIFNNEIMKSLDCNFTDNALKDSNLILNAFFENNQLFNISSSVIENSQRVLLSLPNGEISKQLNYKNDRIESIVIKDHEEINMTQYAYEGDSLIIRKSYNSLAKKFLVSKQRYKDNLMQCKIFFRTSGNPEVKKVKKKICYNYDSYGRLINEMTSDKKGRAIDSTAYFYENSLLTGVIKYIKNGQSSIINQYDSKGLLKKKLIKTAEMQIELNYNYDENKRIDAIEINNMGTPYRKKCFFSYNQDSRLIAMKTYDIHMSTEQMYFNSQYLFNYMNNGTLNSLKAVDEEGIIKKEVVYELEFISNE